MEVECKKKKPRDSVSEYDISLSEELKRVFPLDRIRKPELIVGKSEILDIDDIGNIVQLVVKAETCAWSLAYSSSIHKRTLPDLYARLSYVSATDSPMILLVKDTMKRVQGVFLPNFNLTGDGEEEEIGGELFHCRPTFCRFQGKTEEPLRLQKQILFLSVVDKSAKCGIWIDGLLERGKIEEYSLSDLESQSTENIFEQSRFCIKTLECWMISEVSSEAVEA